MGERHDFTDAYRQRARIVDEQRGRRPFRLLVYTPNGCCSHNGIYHTYGAARNALDSLGYCWSETHPAGAYIVSNRV